MKPNEKQNFYLEGIMDNIEHRSVVKFLFLEGNDAKSIHNRMTRVYGNTSPAYSTVAKWVALFRMGRVSVQDDARSGRPSDAVTHESVSAIQNLVESDRRMTVRYLAEQVGLSTERVRHILHECLLMRKVAARWVPKMLTNFDMQRRMETSEAILDQFGDNWNELLLCLITMDETWLYHYDPESKQQSMIWKRAEEPPPTKFRKSRSAGKVMMSIFWDSKGAILVRFVDHGETVNGAYHANLLHELRNAVKEKRRGMLARGVLLLQDNAPAHTAAIATRAIKDCGFGQLSHPPYSPDLAPSDYHLFSHLKRDMRGRHFYSDNDVKNYVKNWLDEKDESFFSEGIVSLKSRLLKCVELRGSYVEK